MQVHLANAEAVHRDAACLHPGKFFLQRYGEEIQLNGSIQPSGVPLRGRTAQRPPEMSQLAPEGQVAERLLLLGEESRAELRTSKEEVHPEWREQHLQEIHLRREQVHPLDRLIQHRNDHALLRDVPQRLLKRHPHGRKSL